RRAGRPRLFPRVRVGWRQALPRARLPAPRPAARPRRRALGRARRLRLGRARLGARFQLLAGPPRGSGAGPGARRGALTARPTSGKKIIFFVLARGNAEHHRAGLPGRGQLGEGGAAVDLEHAVLARLPHVVHGAAAADVAAVLVIQADVELHRTLDGLDDLQEGDLARRAGQLVAAVRAPDAPDDPARDEDLEDLGEELAWQVQRRSEVLSRGDPPVRDA